MIDIPTLLFVLACALFIVAWCAFFFSVATAFAESSGAPRSPSDVIALVLSGVLMLASGVLHWAVGTWGWFAWPWAIIALLLALLIARSNFVLSFRIGAPAFLVVVTAALLLPIFL